MAQLMPLTLTCFRSLASVKFRLVPAHLDSPGQRADKRMCVCVSDQLNSATASDSR